MYAEGGELVVLENVRAGADEYRRTVICEEYRAAANLNEIVKGSCRAKVNNRSRNDLQHTWNPKLGAIAYGSYSIVDGDVKTDALR